MSPARALEVGWLALALLVPVTFQRWSYDAFELPKQVVTFVVLQTALLAALSLWVAERPWRRPGWLSGEAALTWLGRQPVALAAGGVALAWLLATAASVAPEQSWWGLPPRWSGTRAQLANASVFLAGALAFRRAVQLLRLAAVTAVAGALSAAYALVQRAGRDPVEWGGAIGAQVAADLTTRPPGTFGNPNFLAGYLVLSVFVTLGALLTVQRVWWRAPLGASLLLQLLALLFTQTRGAWLGTAIGLVVFAGILVGLRRGPWRRVLAATAFAVVVTLVGLRAAAPVLPPGTLLARAADILSPTEGTASIRLALWRLAAPEALKRPWLGYGPDAIAPVFQRVYGQELVEAEGRLTGSLYDRSENAVLDTLLATGAVGALSIAFVGAFVVRALFTLIQRRPPAQAALVAGATAALAAHLTAQQFNVEVVGASFLAWLLAGALIGLATVHHYLRSAPSGALGMRSAALALALAGGAGLAWWEARPLRAGMSYEAGLTLQRSGMPVEAIPLLQRGAQEWPHYFLYWAELAYANRAAARGTPAGPERERYYAQALAAVDRALSINSSHPLVWSYWGDVAAEVSVGRADQGLRARARVAHLRATSLAPGWSRYWQSAAETDMLLGAFGAAKEKYTRAAALSPGSWVLWASLGDAASRSGDYAMARSAYERAIGLRPGAQMEATIERAIASLPPFVPE